MRTLVIVHDGSYMPHVDRHVCSAAFMIYCTRTKSRAKGTVVERCEDADNYRAEILGGIMVQLVLLAALQNKACPYRTTRIDCDNRGVVQHGNAAGVALKEKQPQADVLRVLKHLITKHCFAVDYQWVASHQGNRKAWRKLLLWEKVNEIVDKLVKQSLVTGVAEGDYID